MRDASEISGYHAHLYFEPATRDTAVGLREPLAARWPVELGRIHDRPIGPHTRAMYQVAFATGDFAAIVPWLMLNRAGLSILVHPMTGDEVADHGDHPLWLGPQLDVDLDFLRRVVAAHA